MHLAVQRFEDMSHVKTFHRHSRGMLLSQELGLNVCLLLITIQLNALIDLVL